MGQELFTEDQAVKRARKFLTEEKINLKTLAEEDAALAKLFLEFQARGTSQSIRGALDNLQTMIHGLAVKNGWYDPEVLKKPLEAHMLIVSEVAEASEAFRDRKPYAYVESGIKGIVHELGSAEFDDSTHKPEGEIVELADAVIRILDYAEFCGVSLADCIIKKHEYNATRPYRHGGKVA